MKKKPKALVLVRGLIRTGSHWYGFDQTIENKYAGCFDKIFTVDLPVGQNLKEQIRLSNPVNFISELNSKIPEGYELTYFGVSLAGLAGINLLSTYPNKYKKVIAINTSHPKLSNVFERIKFIPALVIFLTRLFKKSECEREILFYTINDSSIRLQYLEKATLLFKKNPWTINQLFSQLVVATKLKKIPSSGKALAILASQNDMLVPIKNSKVIAKSLQSHLYLNHKAGHDLTTEDPDWVLDTLDKIFEG